MCNGEIMGKDHTLEFVFMTRWRVTVGKAKHNKLLSFRLKNTLKNLEFNLNVYQNRCKELIFSIFSKLRTAGITGVNCSFMKSK